MRKFVGDGQRLRPFVCNGDPLTCDVFVVGYNPATNGTSFWDYWEPGYGFRKDRWLKDYIRSRLARGKTELSNTRERLKRIEQGAAPVRILETNVISYAAAKPRDIPVADRVSQIFQFIWKSVQPRFVLAHGVKTQRILDNLGITYLPESAEHLRSWSYPRAIDFGRWIREQQV